MHDGLAQTAQHENKDDNAFEQNARHSNAPVDADAEYQRVGNNGVNAHARCQRKRSVRDDAHHDGHDRTAEAGRSKRGFERNARIDQNRRVHRDDICHREEGRKTADNFAPNRTAAFRNLE